MFSVILCIVRIVVNICLRFIFFNLVLVFIRTYHPTKKRSQSEYRKAVPITRRHHIQPAHRGRIKLTLFPTSFSMAWYKMVMQSSAVVYKENTTCYLYFLAVTRLKARVHRERIQVTRGIFIVYHEGALNNLFIS